MTVSTTIRTKSTKIYLEPGDATTCLAGGTIVMGKFVMLDPDDSGLGNHPKVVEATAGKPIYGVAHHSAADETEVSVLRRGTVGVVTGSGNLTSGAEVSVGANGTAVAAAAGSQLGNGNFTVTAPTVRVGICVADATAPALAAVTLYAKHWPLS